MEEMYQLSLRRWGPADTRLKSVSCGFKKKLWFVLCASKVNKASVFVAPMMKSSLPLFHNFNIPYPQSPTLP